MHSPRSNTALCEFRLAEEGECVCNMVKMNMIARAFPNG